MKNIKIVLADDHPLFRKGLKDTLEEENDFEILGEAVNGQEALDKIIQFLPDIAILDLDMPVMNGIEASKILLKSQQKTKIIILSMHKDPDIIRAAMALGIHAYVFKDDAVNDLVNAIRAVFDGGTYISTDQSVEILSSKESLQRIGELTKMERLILREIAQQKTTKEIASTHYISTKTVENHRANICRKLNLSGNNSLLKFAIKLGESLKTD